MRRSSNFKYIGLVLIFLALFLMVGFFTLGTYCLGVSTFLGCGGLSVPLNLLVGIIIAIIGTLVYLRS